MGCSQYTFETIKFVVSVVAPVITGWLGLQYGLRQLKESKRLSYIEKQLSEFYSPLLGLREEIRVKSELRAKVQKAGDELWRENVSKGLEPATQPITKEIEYNNKQFKEELVPMYHQMLKIFRDGYWLAEPKTKEHYSLLVEYVEGWNRFLGKGVTGEIMQKLGHSEEKLKPFYDELVTRTEILRLELAQNSSRTNLLLKVKKILRLN